MSDKGWFVVGPDDGLLLDGLLVLELLDQAKALLLLEEARASCRLDGETFSVDTCGHPLCANQGTTCSAVRRSELE